MLVLGWKLFSFLNESILWDICSPKWSKIQTNYVTSIAPIVADDCVRQGLYTLDTSQSNQPSSVTTDHINGLSILKLIMCGALWEILLSNQSQNSVLIPCVAKSFLTFCLITKPTYF